MSRFGRGRVGSCTPRWRAAASDRTTCSARRPARGGCVTCWWRCGAWLRRNADRLSDRLSHPEGWARSGAVLKDNLAGNHARASASCFAGPRLQPGNIGRTPAIFLRMKLVLFDIDGTRLWTDGAGRRAIQRALADEAGTAGPIETYRFDGNTDPQIVRDLLSLAGHSGAENTTVIQAVCRRYVEHLRTELERPTQTTRLMVGIADLLAALERPALGLVRLEQRRAGSSPEARIGRTRPRTL